MTQSELHDHSSASAVSLEPIPGSNGHQATIPIDASQPLELSVTNTSGKVRVVASDQPNVWVVARQSNGHGNGDGTGDGIGDADDRCGVRIDVDGNRIAVHPDWAMAAGVSGIAQKVKEQVQQGLSSGNWNMATLGRMRLGDLVYDLRIELPRQLAAGSKVQVKTASGDVHVAGLTADVTVATASADADLSDLNGQIAVHTASGDIAIERVSGSLEINTASGDLRVRGADAWTALRTISGDLQIEDTALRNARIATVSGDLHATVALDTAGPYSFETVSGDLTIDGRYPVGTNATASFRTLSGGTHVSGAWAGDGRKSWRIPGDVDGPRIQAKSVSGDLKMTGRVDPSLTLRHEEPKPGAATPREESSASGSDLDDIRAHARHAAATSSAAAQEVRRAFEQHRTAPDTAQPTEPLVTPPPGPTPHQPTTRLTPPIPPTPPTPATPPQTGTRIAQDAVDREAPGEAGQTAAATDTTGIDAEDAERLRVLEALERGEIDVDEALVRLEGDEARNQ